jgi:hypothetical protein
MAKLPDDLNNRFFLYLNIMPVIEKVAMYLFFCTGVMFLLGSISRILLLNWDLQKQCTNIDFSYRNSKELKRMKSREKRPAQDTRNTAETFYTSLLAPLPADDTLECGLNSTEMDILADNASKISSTIIPFPNEGIDNYSCDKMDIPPRQCDLIKLSHLKEANV